MLNYISTALLAFIVITQVAVTTPNYKESPFSFPNKFEMIKLKGQLKVVEVRADDPFEWPLHQCIPSFYEGQIGNQGYYLEDKKRINRITVTEYIFRNSSSASEAYLVATNHADTMRKTRRDRFSDLCFNMPSPRIYYASRFGSHVFLYTIFYNFMYHSGAESVETNIKRDGRILVDDLYQQMVKVK